MKSALAAEETAVWRQTINGIMIKVTQVYIHIYSTIFQTKQELVRMQSRGYMSEEMKNSKKSHSISLNV